MRYYDFSDSVSVRPSRRVKRKKSKVLGFFLLAFILLPFIIVQYFLNKDELTPKPESLVLATESKHEPTPTPTLAASVPLENIVRSSLEGTKGKYSIVIKNLKTDEYYILNEKQTYQSASLYKLWIMAVAHNQLQSGAIKETDMLSKDVEELNKRFDIASESAELHEGTVTFPVNQAMGQMITISHNYAALLLAQKVKLSNVDEFLKAHNYTQSKIGQPPQTSAHDIALFYEDLYKGKLGDPEHTSQMLELLKKQRLNNKLPKDLPTDIVVAHKTGELGAVTHDAGIVYTPKGEYLIVVMSESTNPAAAEERIAEISKGVYEYFQNQ